MTVPLPLFAYQAIGDDVPPERRFAVIMWREKHLSWTFYAPSEAEGRAKAAAFYEKHVKTLGPAAERFSAADRAHLTGQNTSLEPETPQIDLEEAIAAAPPVDDPLAGLLG